MNVYFSNILKIKLKINLLYQYFLILTLFLLILKGISRDLANEPPIRHFRRAAVFFDRELQF